eukprot:COSAG02_NODE_64917_length_259_cov_0.650000_1_plen_53_part_01
MQVYDLPRFIVRYSMYPAACAKPERITAAGRVRSVDYRTRLHVRTGTGTNTTS